MGLDADSYEPSFNNYLAQVHHISEVTRSGWSFPVTAGIFNGIYLYPVNLPCPTPALLCWLL